MNFDVVLSLAVRDGSPLVPVCGARWRLDVPSSLRYAGPRAARKAGGANCVSGSDAQALQCAQRAHTK